MISSRLRGLCALCVGLVLFGAMGGAALAASPLAFPFAVQESELPNGLRVVVVPFDSPGLVAYYSIVRTGSRNEVEPGKSGFAHFFEHMMFRGTDRYSTEKYNDVIKAIGADSNAFTSDDLTVYHLLAGKTSLAKIVEIEADRFRNLHYQEPEFQKESRAVLGEYNKSASDPLQKMFEALCNAAYTTHTYKHTTIGFLKDIEAMPQEFAYSRQFFDRYYRPDNVTILVVGDVTAAQVLPLIQGAYGGWQKGPPRPVVPREPPQTKEQRVNLTWPGATLPVVLMGFHTPAFSTSQIDGAALEVLAALVFSERSPLYKQLVITDQSVDELAAGNEPHVDPNLFTVLARIKKPDAVAAVEKTITAAIDRIAREGVANKPLAEIIAHTRYAFAGRLATADRIALVGAEYIALTGKLGAINDHFALLDRVTSADLKRVARTYFVPANRTVVVLQAGAK